MRDLFMLAILPFLLYTMAKRPFIALGMWVWTSLFYPNAWVYGAAGVIRYNLLFTGIGMIGYMAMRNKPKVDFGPLGICVLIFFLWTSMTTAMGVGNPDLAWDIWNRFAKVILLFVFVLLIVEKKLHVDFLLWGIVLSIGFYANLEGIKYIATGGHHKIAGFNGHVLGDRNELAIAFVMTLPICFYLLSEYGKSSKLLKLALLGTIATLVVSVIGTQSRGGFIALTVIGGYLFMKSRRKGLVGLLIVVMTLVLAQFVSSEWMDRMNTIEAADEDASFMGRVVAWKLSLIMAVQHPLFGGGFKGLEHYPVWLELSRSFHNYSWFYTGDVLPDPIRPHAAHSVYFQVLGDHGFIGLCLYLTVLIGMFRTARNVVRKARAAGAPEWIQHLATMLQLSIFAFGLGGAALSFAYFDMIFALFGLVLVLDRRLLPALAPQVKR